MRPSPMLALHRGGTQARPPASAGGCVGSPCFPRGAGRDVVGLQRMEGGSSPGAVENAQG